MEIVETASPKEEAGKALGTLLEIHKDKPILLMLSGGSAFAILDFVLPTVLGSHITVTVLDERYSTDPQVNNFTQLEQTNFYKVCLEQGVSHVSTKVLPNESIEALRDRFDAFLHTWKEQNREGIVIATMGIGVDGHIAGIFSGEHEVDFNGNDWVVGYSVPREVNEYTNRVTVTNTFLKNVVDYAIGYIERDRKPQFVSRLISNDSSSDLPMSVLHTLKTVRFFTGIQY